MLVTYHLRPGLSTRQLLQVEAAAAAAFGAGNVLSIETEGRVYVECEAELTADQRLVLEWLLRDRTAAATGFAAGASTLAGGEEGAPPHVLLELGPRLNFSTAWSTNATTICRVVGLATVKRMERSRRVLVRLGPASSSNASVTAEQRAAFAAALHDRMTECVYERPLETLEVSGAPQPWKTVPVMAEGRAALGALDAELGLAFDEWDLDYYTQMFVEKMGRDPSDVECFDISQSNSEHSRHWFFKGKIVVDGKEQPVPLFELVTRTLRARQESARAAGTQDNSAVAFADNSSSIAGTGPVTTLRPGDASGPSAFRLEARDLDVTFTAETHNFPTGVAPFPGAETGTGGRIRDGFATGQGSVVTAASAGYSVGQLHIPGYEQPWESADWAYPPRLARPLDIEVEASNGASNYGNEFGEPLILGYTRSLGLALNNGERREYAKPIMFTGGIGNMEEIHRKKAAAAKGMTVVKIGGPAYRVGIGGGSASSMVQGQNTEALDFNAVQRGDAEMESKVNRVIRACVEMGEGNPIKSIHDQGAGGNANVLKEISEPAGAVIDLRKLPIGDPTLSVLELWGAEYQENAAMLIPEDQEPLFEKICKREGAPFGFVGKVDGSGRLKVVDSKDGSTPVDLDLELVLGKMPQKTFTSGQPQLPTPEPLVLPEGLTVRTSLERVLRLMGVGSKAFLTNKVDRSVTGLVAQQQCVGPLHTPLADFGATSLGYFGLAGAATSIGEQPVRGLLDPCAMARATVAEAVTNLAFAGVDGLEHTKAAANWMWAAKLPGEAAAMYQACEAMCDAMVQLDLAIDGGKDSLSMAARLADGTTIKSPGTLVVSLYCTMPDITVKATPDLKRPGASTLLLLEAGAGARSRTGGSALAQVFSQLGAECPDLDEPAALKAAFQAVQALLRERRVLAGHDRSDGGLIVSLLEMAFAGNCGFKVELPGALVHDGDVMSALFAEEPGLVMEVATAEVAAVQDTLAAAGVKAHVLGVTTVGPRIEVLAPGGSSCALDESMTALRDVWSGTSFQLERLQANPRCIEAEEAGYASRAAPPQSLGFEVPTITVPIKAPSNPPRVAVIREEGSNGDREMAAAFVAAGFEAWDVKMSDLVQGLVTLETFRGVAFVGGFSFADVLGSAKGWAAVIRYNPKVLSEFTAFKERPDSFSLGVCNGCQLMGLLGWIDAPESSTGSVVLTHNESNRYESRWVTVRVAESTPAVLLAGMGGSSLGVWVSHGEGKFDFAGEPAPAPLSACAPLAYVDDANAATDTYPHNPNGSPGGIAAMCSPDGRHFAMMPHPERCFLTWQSPWLAPAVCAKLPAGPGVLPVSPWARLFANAFAWCQANGGR